MNGGAVFTNDPEVTINAVSPRFATGMVIPNDGGFASPLVVPVAESVAWRLDSSGPERLPKVVYVRLEGGESGGEAYGFGTYTDDIVLDETSPRVQAATLAGSGAGAASVA